MMQLEREIKEMRADLAEIKRALGIGATLPAGGAAEIKRQAAEDFERITRRRRRKEKTRT
jgi:hypothetical protein